MPPESLIDWPDPLLELLEFVAAFWAVGACGFRFAVIGGVRRSGFANASADPVLATALRRAAWIGLAGALYGLHDVAMGLPGAAARQHTSVAALLTSFTPAGTRFYWVLLATLGFLAAVLRRDWGWWLAAIGILGGTLRNAMFGQWRGLLKPIHLLAGGLWIGTLFVLVVVGITVALETGTPREKRGTLVAAMVHAFSPLALVSAAVLAFFGIVMARLELQPLSLLWTTPWGKTLVAKLLVVFAVVAVGAWNWRRQKPQLGSEAAALALRRSAGLELAIAALVLVVTSILTSLPDPK